MSGLGRSSAGGGGRFQPLKCVFNGGPALPLIRPVPLWTASLGAEGVSLDICLGDSPGTSNAVLGTQTVRMVTHHDGLYWTPTIAANGLRARNDGVVKGSVP